MPTLAEPVLDGEFITDGERLLMVLTLDPDAEAYWAEDAAQPFGEAEVERVKVRDIGTRARFDAGEVKWRVVERG